MRSGAGRAVLLVRVWEGPWEYQMQVELYNSTRVKQIQSHSVASEQSVCCLLEERLPNSCVC